MSPDKRRWPAVRALLTLWWAEDELSRRPGVLPLVVHRGAQNFLMRRGGIL